MSDTRRITVALAALIVALFAFIVASPALTGPFTASKVWSGVGLLTIVLAIAGTGLVVARHQPRNPVGWLLAAEGVFILLNTAAASLAGLIYQSGYRGLSFAGLPALVLSQMFSGSLIVLPLVILLFPDGRLPSPRWRGVVAAYLALSVIALLATLAGVLQVAVGEHVVIEPDGNLATFGHGRTAWAASVEFGFLVLVAAFWVAAVVRQALSWRRSAGERRQQLKWLASGAAIGGITGIAAVSTSSGIWKVLIFGFAALPLSIGIGILKYRLYEIDRLISRTLAYAIVTGLLVGVYAGLVLLATELLKFRTPVAVAAATLTAAALFSPLRRRVQQVVDRRFNRARYDAGVAVTAFAGRLQDAVDLETVRTDLTSVVDVTLEPAHVSVWISPPGQRLPSAADG